jgi:hypothetical protein
LEGEWVERNVGAVCEEQLGDENGGEGGRNKEGSLGKIELSLLIC